MLPPNARRALRRGITLILLGFVYQGFLGKLDFATFRIPSVLGYIAACWLFLLFLYRKNVFLKV